MADLRFRISANSETPTKTVVKARGFQIIIDEPADLGGSDSAANPVEYVLAAFAGCLNVMAHVVARELGFTLRNVTIDIAGTLNPEKLFGQPTEDRAGYKEITVKMRPDCDADAETLKKWLEAIGERCPVCDNLKNPTPVKLALGKC